MTLSDLGEAERSNIRLMIYHKACEVLNAGNREQRRSALERVPETVRGEVEREAIRLYQSRNQ